VRACAAALAAFAAAAPPAGASGHGTCSGGATQADLDLCADRAYRAADIALNEAFATARAVAARMDREDKGGPGRGGAVGAEEMLRHAQRAWLPFRDGACAVEALPFEGGSVQTMVRLGCLERQTRQRTADLRIFAGMIN